MARKFRGACGHWIVAKEGKRINRATQVAIGNGSFRRPIFAFLLAHILAHYPTKNASRLRKRPGKESGITVTPLSFYKRKAAPNVTSRSYSPW